MQNIDRAKIREIIPFKESRYYQRQYVAGEMQGERGGSTGLVTTVNRYSDHGHC